MVDPASVAQLVGLGAQLADECIQVIKRLKEYRERFHDTSHTLGVLSAYCRIIHAAIQQIQTWARTSASVSSIPTSSIVAIQDATADILTCVRMLHHDTKIVLGDLQPTELSFGAKMKSLWTENVMLKHSQQIHILAGGLQLLLSATMMYGYHLNYVTHLLIIRG